jgi:hypothetical protein
VIAIHFGKGVNEVCAESGVNIFWEELGWFVSVL